MSSDKPLVSIVVPVYKASATIERCVRSLMEQTYREIEFVFVDDGSPDDSVGKIRSVAAGYPDRKVLVVRQENQGVCAARRKGMEQVTGDFVLQVDSDDWVEERMVESLVGCMLRTRADIVYCDYFLEYPDRTEILPMAARRRAARRRRGSNRKYSGRRFSGSRFRFCGGERRGGFAGKKGGASAGGRRRDRRGGRGALYRPLGQCRRQQRGLHRRRCQSGDSRRQHVISPLTATGAR